MSLWTHSVLPVYEITSELAIVCEKRSTKRYGSKQISVLGFLGTLGYLGEPLLLNTHHGLENVVTDTTVLTAIIIESLSKAMTY